MVQLTCAVIVCLSLFGKIVNAAPGYAAGYDVDYYVREHFLLKFGEIKCNHKDRIEEAPKIQSNHFFYREINFKIKSPQ